MALLIRLLLAVLALTASPSLAIGWDGADNMTSLTDALAPARSQAFGHDELYRLDTASGAYGAYDWAHDAVGDGAGEVPPADQPGQFACTSSMCAEGSVLFTGPSR